MAIDEPSYDHLYVAVDLGAGSGRVFLVGFELDSMLLQEVHRFEYPPRHVDGYLRWDFTSILREIRSGLSRVAEQAGALGRTVASIGIDSWGVDYGLIDKYGQLIGDPVCYRDRRTTGIPQRVFQRLPAREIYERTGIQIQSFNTLYQLVAENGPLETVDRFLLLPDLVGYLLTGAAECEFTNGTTTQMINLSSGTWDVDLIDQVGLDAAIFPDIVHPGTKLGKLKPEFISDQRLASADVIAVASHDTASAVAAAPLFDDTSAFISSGTWSLVGVESDRPFVDQRALEENFTNEGGVDGTVRFLKNVMGLWILESCRREWRDVGRDASYDEILQSVTTVSGFRGFIFPDDPRFLNPRSMLEVIAQQLNETGQQVPATIGEIAKMILDSLAFRYASVLSSIRSITGRDIMQLEILGGGGRNGYLNQITSDACGIPVRSGLIEATVVGNALVQAVSSGRFSSLAQGRRFIEQNCTFERYEPRVTREISGARESYRRVELHYSRQDAAAAS